MLHEYGVKKKEEGWPATIIPRWTQLQEIKPQFYKSNMKSTFIQTDADIWLILTDKFDQLQMDLHIMYNSSAAASK